MIEPMRADRGAASVVAVGIASVSLFCVSAAGLVGQAGATRVSLESAADVAALAAADAVAGFVSRDACDVAAHTASLNDARLLECEVAGPDVSVLVGTSVLGFAVSARARAGPPR